MAIDTREVILEGFLGEKYGRKWNIAATEYKDIFACIEANYPQSRQDIIDLFISGGDISIQTGSTLMQEQEEYLFPIGEGTIIITPIATGSKSGTAKIIAAVAIVALMWWNPVGWAMAGGFAGSAAAAGTLGAGFSMVAAGASMSVVNLALMGLAVNLAITGIQQLMAPDPSVDDPDNSNYLFNGPENTTVSGAPVPVLCGEMMIGGIVISSGSIGGFWGAEATYVEEPVWTEGVAGNRYNPPVPPTGTPIFVGGKYLGVKQITVHAPPIPTTTALQNTVFDQSLGIKTLGTDEFTMSYP